MDKDVELDTQLDVEADVVNWEQISLVAKGLEQGTVAVDTKRSMESLVQAEVSEAHELEAPIVEDDVRDGDSMTEGVGCKVLTI